MAELKLLLEFKKSLTTYSSIKNRVKKKLDLLTKNPSGILEPLKYDLEGLSSCSVDRNFIIVCVYCLDCRRKKYIELIKCPDCTSIPDETVKVMYVAPHDAAYKTVKRSWLRRLIS